MADFDRVNRTYEEWQNSRNEATSPTTPESKGVLERIGETFSSVGDTLQNLDFNGFNEANIDSDSLMAETTGVTADFVPVPEETHSLSEVIDDALSLDYSPEAMINGARDWTKEYIENEAESGNEYAQTIRRSDAYQEYIMNDEDRLQKAQEIEEFTGINAGDIAWDPKAYSEALRIYDYEKKRTAMGATPDQIWEELPELAQIADKNAQDAAIALHNVYDVRHTRDVIDTFNKFGDLGKMKLRQDLLWKKKYDGELTETEQQELDELDRKIKAAENIEVNPVDNPFLYAVATASESAPEMARSIVEGAGSGLILGTIAGSVATILTANPAVGIAVGKAVATTAGAVGTFAGMYDPEVGSRYKEFSELKDANGNKLLTDEEAKYYAKLGGTLNAGIETLSLGMLKNVVSKPLGKAMENYVTNKAITEIISAEIIKRSAAKEALKEAMKPMLEGGAVEGTEEFWQSIADDLIWNNMVGAHPDSGYKAYSTSEMLSRGAQAGLAAIPAGALFGAVGGVPGGINAGIQQNNINRLFSYTSSYDSMHATQTINGARMLEGLQDAVQNGKLNQSAPEVQRQIIRSQIAELAPDKAMVHVDVELAMQSDKGKEDIQKLAEAQGMSEEELNKAIEGGTMNVATEVFAQVPTSPEILNAVTFDQDATPIGRIQEQARQDAEDYKRIMQNGIRSWENLKKNAIAGVTDKDELEAIDMAFALGLNESPKDGLKQYRGTVQGRFDEVIAPAMEALQRGMKQGVDININQETGQGTKISNNEKWYRDFYAEHHRAPSKAELQEMAYQMTIGDNAAPQVEGWTARSAADVAGIQQSDEAIEARQLHDKLAAIDRINTKMQSLDKTEVALTQNLSKEAIDAYHVIWGLAEKASGNNARTRVSNRFAAIMLARHADIMAQRYNRLHPAETPITALDWIKRIDIREGQDEDAGGYHQESAETNNKDTGEIPRYADLREENDTNTVEFNLTTETDDVRAQRKAMMEKMGFTPKEIQQTEEYFYGTDKKKGIIQEIQELAEKYNDFGEFQNKLSELVKNKAGQLVPKVSAFVSNGEYDLNIDLGTSCIRREAREYAISILIRDGKIQQLGPQEIELIDQALKEAGYAVACKCCFVEARRVRSLDSAETISFQWNAVVDALGITDQEKVWDGTRTGVDRSNISDEVLRRLDMMTSDKLVPGTKETESDVAFRTFIAKDKRRGKGDNGVKKARMKRIANLMKQDHGLIGRMDSDTLMQKAGSDAMQERFYKTGWGGFIASADGAGTPKPMHGTRPFDAHSFTEIWDNLLSAANIDWTKKENAIVSKLRYVYSIGGMRGQSFSDFNVLSAFDYMQMIAECAARRLPMHMYTKVPELVDLFGQCNIKINMSLVPNVKRGPHPKYGKAPAGLKYDDNGKLVYDWADESFPPEKAFEYRKRSEYNGNVGIIAIAVSKEQFEMMLNDPNIDMVIPYHESGMPVEVRSKTGFTKENGVANYTNYQNTKHKSKDLPKGAKTPAIKKEFRFNSVLRAVQAAGEASRKVAKKNRIQENTIDQEYIDALSEVMGKDIIKSIKNKKNASKAAADIYLEWCDKMGYTPKFAEFRDNPNYYKVLEDFRGYDEKGNPSPQRAMRLELPADHMDILDKAIKRRISDVSKMKGMEENSKLVERLHQAVAYQRVTKVVKARIITQLGKVLGNKNVHVLNSNDLLNKLEEMNAMKPEKLQQFRDGNGIIYGFAVGNQVYLNDDRMNANTPAHEFTHIWAKVVNKERPDVWKRGKELLKGTKVWQEVLEDEAYEHLKGDEDAIASEVLARIVGSKNEDLVAMVVGNDAVKRTNAAGVVTEKIKKWLNEFFQTIKDILGADNPTIRNMTLEEFTNAPLAALYHDEEAARFADLLKQYQTEARTEISQHQYEYSMEQNETFNQQTNATTEFGQNLSAIVRLFETADESTLIHEFSHIFLRDLEYFATIDPVAAKELETVHNWADWKKGDAYKYYRDTPWYKEFAAREQQIIDAENGNGPKDANGNPITADALKRAWFHERFARGFELYLKEGKAPVPALRKIFQKFKDWMKTLYGAFINEGAMPSRDVRMVMDRMIATEDEIRYAAMDERWADIEEAGGEKLLTESEKETYERWLSEAKAEAEDKLRKIVMRDLNNESQTKFRKRIDDERKRYTEELQKQPVYMAQRALEETGDENIVLNWFGSVEEFVDATDGVPLLEDAVNQHMQEFEAQADKERIDGHFSDETIQQVMRSDKYMVKRKALEEAALERKERLVNRVNDKAKAAMQGIEEALENIPEDVEIADAQVTDDPQVMALLTRISKLNYAGKWNGPQMNMINAMLKAATKAEVKAKLKEFKDSLKNEKINLDAVEKATEGQIRAMREQARKQVLESPINIACDYTGHIKKAKTAERNCNAMIKGKKYDMAVGFKRQATYSYILAEESKKMQEEVEKLLKKVEKQHKARSVKLPKDERYWHSYLLYCLRIIPEEPQKPEGVAKLEEIYQNLVDSLDIQYVPSDIIEMSRREDWIGYRSLRLDELQDAVDALTVLYTTGKDKFNMKSVKGVTLEEAIDSVLGEHTDKETGEVTYHSQPADNISTDRHTIEDDKGGLGYIRTLAKIPGIGEWAAKQGPRFLSMIIQPGTIFNTLGKGAKTYLQDLYAEAFRKEQKMNIAHIKTMEDLLSAYSKKERRTWKEKKYSFTNLYETQLVSKEEMFCMALNMGNRTNIARLVLGLDAGRMNPENGEIDTRRVKEFLNEHMTKKDWELVQSIWKYLDSYWEETCKVEEQLNGVALHKVENGQIRVIAADTGEEMVLDGGYYPIKYNPAKSSKAQDQADVTEAVRRLSGAQVLGTGRGFTKARTDVNVCRPLLLSFDVINDHCMNVIHNICYRIAARDVYRIVKSARVEDYFRESLGADYHRVLQEWAADSWAVINGDTNTAAGAVNQIASFLRRNSVMAIMGYKLWPAIENVSNIALVADQIGTLRAAKAVTDFYANPKDNLQLLRKSIFMSNRLNSMDPDLRRQRELFVPGNAILEQIKGHAYWLMEKSDLMFSAPLWCSVYKNSLAKNIGEVQAEQRELQLKLDILQKEYDEINAQIIDSRRAVGQITEEQQARYGGFTAAEENPFRVKRDIELHSSKVEAQENIKNLQEKLWKKETELELARDSTILEGDDIFKEAERRTIIEADQAVKDCFGSSAAQDMSSVQRSKNEYVKLFTTFYSFFNTQFNALLKNYIKGRYGMRADQAAEQIDISKWSTYGKWAPFARAILFRIVITAAIGSVLKFALGLEGSSDDDKWKKKKGADGKEHWTEVPWSTRLAGLFAKNIVGTTFGALPFIRDIANYAVAQAFDGNTYGRGINVGSTVIKGVSKLQSTVEMIAKQSEHNLKIEEAKEKREERLKKMSKKARAKYEADEKYRKPQKLITNTDIAKSAVNAVTTLSASYTGITNTVGDSIFTVMQYMNDTDNIYDKQWQNVIWSVLFDKKPVERSIPKKPETEPKKKKNRK